MKTGEVVFKGMFPIELISLSPKSKLDPILNFQKIGKVEKQNLE